MPRLSYIEIETFTGTEEQLDGLIHWRTGDIEVLRHYTNHLPTNLRGAYMQRQITIEVRVDFADNDKNAEIRTTAQQCALRLLATCNLIADNPKATRIAIWSDDFYSGHEEIALLEDVLGDVTKDTINQTGDEPSAELLNALKDS